MNSGLNNQNSLLYQLTPAQLEEYQQQLRQHPTSYSRYYITSYAQIIYLAINYLFQIIAISHPTFEQQHEIITISEHFSIVIGQSYQNLIIAGSVQFQSWQDIINSISITIS
ncbi:unnamed protein product (macronuclear) [Paramecium tetraurelia]|uniref:Uncharacterized protein n=1 Tax=Paramecium tetraurelia TaxID=5888 RepID=A0C4Q2_PARTE|nr:uncharacterized protein GSPATT00006268001 [Paramecium tetraurelia]CAK65769.1 unnamed protein product [Paramecium tetraurelia]|eukprot:XP_001433166.1 hypothetical protein (macronuclear) [Paramecium tetraurelia strain d4-2]